MLTIKQVTPLGHEYVYEARMVSFSPKHYFEDASGGKGALLDTLFLDIPGQPEYPMSLGTVYVMNDAGKTVSVYHLGGFPEPIARIKSEEPILQNVKAG